MEGEIQTCTNVLITWLTSGSAEIWLRSLYWAAGLVIVWLAYLALNTRTYQAKATFLLRLSERFSEMQDARTAVGNIKSHILSKISKKHSDLEDYEREKELRNAFKNEMRKIRNGKSRDFNVSDYKSIFILCGFLEIVGLMVKRGYVSQKDIIDWLKGPLEDFDLMFSEHIDERQKEFGISAGYFENALWLSKKVKKSTRKR